MITKTTKASEIEGVIKDTSHLLSKNWTEIGHILLLILAISITVWAFCSILQLSITYITTRLFAPFNSIKTAHHEQVVTGMFILIIALLISGFLRTWLVKNIPRWKDAAGNGADEAIDYFRKTYQQTEHPYDATIARYQKPTFSTAIRRVFITILSIGMGGSGGIEGPIIPIGECLGAGWSRIAGVKRPHDLRVFQMSGIAAAIGTLLNAPFAAALFSGEIVFAEKIVYRTLLYSMIAAVIVYILNNHLLHFEPLFYIQEHTYIYAPREYLEVLLVAIVCSAPAGLGMHYFLQKLKKFMEIFPTPLQILIATTCIAGIVILLWLTLNIYPQHILGIGDITLEELINGTSPHIFNVWWILLLLAAAKLFTTGFTYATGGSVGFLIPAMYMGGVVGAAVYHILIALHIPVFSTTPGLFIISGIATSLVGIIEIPLATIAFIMEVFGAKFASPAILAVVICYLIVKRLKLYRKKI